MTIFSGIYLIILLRIICESKTVKTLYVNILVFTCILDIVFDRGTFIIGSHFINCASVTRLVLLILSVYILYVSKKVNTNYTLLCVALGAILFSGISYEVLVPYDREGIFDITEWDGYVQGTIQPGRLEYFFSEGIKHLASVFMMLLSLYVVKFYLTREQLLEAVKNIYTGGRILIYYGVTEFVIRNILQMPELPHTMMRALLGDLPSNYYSTPGLRGSFYMLLGFQAEPSQFVQQIFFVAVIGIILIKIYLNNNGTVEIPVRSIKVELCICMILMLLSGGFSAVWYVFVILVLMYYLFVKNKFSFSRKINIKKGIVAIGAIVGVLIIAYSVFDDTSYLNARLQQTMEVLDYLLSPTGLAAISFYDSSLARLVSVFDVASYCSDRPLIGFGIGAITAHDSTFTMLADFGILGILFWYKIVTCPVEKDVLYDYKFILIMILLSGLVVGSGRIFAFRIFAVVIFEATKLYMCVGKSVNKGEVI